MEAARLRPQWGDRQAGTGGHATLPKPNTMVAPPFLSGGVPSTSLTATQTSYSRVSEMVIFAPIYTPNAYLT